LVGHAVDGALEDIERSGHLEFEDRLQSPPIIQWLLVIVNEAVREAN